MEWKCASAGGAGSHAFMGGGDSGGAGPHRVLPSGFVMDGWIDPTTERAPFLSSLGLAPLVFCLRSLLVYSSGEKREHSWCATLEY
jgi:hypothetical protein